MDSTKNERLIIPFKKFSRLKVKQEHQMFKGYEVHVQKNRP